MHQSHFKPFTQLSYLDFIYCGYQLSCAPASRNNSFKSRYFMNHCLVIIYSTAVPHRSCTFTVWEISSFPFSSPCSAKSSTIAFLAFFMYSPAYSPAASFIRPLSSITEIHGKLCVFHHSTSVLSPAVQHITIPVPLSGSASSSSIMGTSCPNSGTVAILPLYFLYLSSEGL